MIDRARHLEEQRLFDSYMAERGGEPIDPRIAEHLADCGMCGTRYAELTVFMDTLRSDGDAEADAIFTPERLRLQQQQIARRIAQVGRSPRVLSFPGRIVQQTLEASRSRVAPRWIAATAAAGLFVGVAVGASIEWRSQLRRQSIFAAESGRARAPRVAPAAPSSTSPADGASDDAFLSDLEIALERPHTRELKAFDELTPHLREIRDQR